MNPTVSVIIPAYNAVRYLDGSVGSVLAQTWIDFELIVVDDGSTDDTAHKVRSYADHRIRLVQQVNRGLAGARNAGIRAARGEFIGFLDADDLWHPEKLARHVAHLRSDRSIGVSYSVSAFINEDGSDMHLLQKPKLTDVHARDVFLRNPVGNGSAPVIRRQTLMEIAFESPVGTPGEWWYFDERLRQSEDIDCWLRIAVKTPWVFAGLPQALTYYRVNSGGLSAVLEKQYESWEWVVEHLRAIAPCFVAKHEGAARAYQLRYLARRALTNGNAFNALRLLWKALRIHPRLLVEEPVRTVITFGAAFARVCLPEPLWREIYQFCRQCAGRLQRAF